MKHLKSLLIFHILLMNVAMAQHYRMISPEVDNDYSATHYNVQANDLDFSPETIESFEKKFPYLKVTHDNIYNAMFPDLAMKHKSYDKWRSKTSKLEEEWLSEDDS